MARLEESVRIESSTCKFLEGVVEGIEPDKLHSGYRAAHFDTDGRTIELHGVPGGEIYETFFREILKFGQRNRYTSIALDIPYIALIVNTEKIQRQWPLLRTISSRLYRISEEENVQRQLTGLLDDFYRSNPQCAQQFLGEITVLGTKYTVHMLDIIAEKKTDKVKIGWLIHQDVEQIGGVGGVISNVAEELYQLVKGTQYSFKMAFEKQ